MHWGETYLVCLIIHAIFCVEVALAATMRSPSFSLPSSSMTMRNSPRPKAAIASSMGSNANSVLRGASRTCCGRAGEAVDGTRGKSEGLVWAPFILREVEGAEEDDSGWLTSAAGAMGVKRRGLWRRMDAESNGGEGGANDGVHGRGILKRISRFRTLGR